MTFVPFVVGYVFVAFVAKSVFGIFVAAVTGRVRRAPSSTILQPATIHDVKRRLFRWRAPIFSRVKSLQRPAGMNEALFDTGQELLQLELVGERVGATMRRGSLHGQVERSGIRALDPDGFDVTDKQPGALHVRVSSNVPASGGLHTNARACTRPHLARDRAASQYCNIGVPLVLK